jgi:citrate lyase beta subunit
MVTRTAAGLAARLIRWTPKLANKQNENCISAMKKSEYLLDHFKQNNKKPIWAMIESCKGVINCETIATSEHIEAIVLGGNDLTKDMKAKFSQDRKHLRYSMSKCVTAARSAGKYVIDAVYMDIKNFEGLKVDCELGRDYGFDGKSLIHPDQIDICNNIFSPSQEELHYANKVIVAWNKAMEEGKSVAVLDGKLIEYLHVHEANAIIKTATIIENSKNL